MLENHVWQSYVLNMSQSSWANFATLCQATGKYSSVHAEPYNSPVCPLPEYLRFGPHIASYHTSQL